MKTFTIANTLWTMSDHLMARMEERGIDECALKYGKSFASVEDSTALLTIFEMDPNQLDNKSYHNMINTRPTTMLQKLLN